MNGQVIYCQGNTRLVRAGNELFPEVSFGADRTGNLLWTDAPPDKVAPILKGAVLHLLDEASRMDQEAYDRAEAAELRRARGH